MLIQAADGVVQYLFAVSHRIGDTRKKQQTSDRLRIDTDNLSVSAEREKALQYSGIVFSGRPDTVTEETCMSTSDGTSPRLRDVDAPISRDMA